MSSINHSEWRELKRKSSSECPRLFYNLNIKDDSYELLLTDLVGIWRNSMTKDDIVAEALNQTSSIDPSESNSQLQVLLRKLEQGLESRKNVLSQEGTKSLAVYLTTRITLPYPLQPLNWTFKLLQQSADALAEHLLRPCLFEASVTKQKLHTLQKVVRDKDHVISRLLEKIDADNTDLSLIFPGITGLRARRGRVTASEAQKHVPGMATFDASSWLKDFESDSPYNFYDNRGINNLISGCEKCPKHTAKQHSDWLEELPKHTSDIHTLLEATDIESFKDEQVTEHSDGDDATASDDDFERQATPPRLRKRNLLRSSSEDGQTPPPKKNRLGKLGTTPHQARSAGRPIPPPPVLSSSPVPEHTREDASIRAQNQDSADNEGSTSSTEEEEDDLDVSSQSLQHKTSSQRHLETDSRSLPPPISPSKSKPKPSSSRPPDSQQAQSNPSTPSRRLGRLSRSTTESPLFKNSNALASSPPSAAKDTTTTTNNNPTEAISKATKITENEGEDNVKSNKETPSKSNSNSNTNSNTSTPSHRRLGRIGSRKHSTSSSTNNSSSVNSTPTTFDQQRRRRRQRKQNRLSSVHEEPGDVKMTDPDADVDPDATPSPSPSPSASPTPKPKRNLENIHNPQSPSSLSSSLTNPADKAEVDAVKTESALSSTRDDGSSKEKESEEKKKNNKKLTAEERADQRREELRKKTNVGVGSSGGGGGGGGTRKKRKF